MYLVYGMERRDTVSAVDRMVGPISPLKTQHVSSVTRGSNDADDDRGAIGTPIPHMRKILYLVLDLHMTAPLSC